MTDDYCLICGDDCFCGDRTLIRNLVAQAIEAQRAETAQTGSVEDESEVAEAMRRKEIRMKQSSAMSDERPADDAALIERLRVGFVLASMMMIERDVRLHDLTDDELRSVLQSAVEASGLTALNAELSERDIDRAVIIEANNSLFGSQSYFLTTEDGSVYGAVGVEGPPSKYHLARAIEKLKAHSNRQYAELSERIEEGERLRGALTDARNNILSLLGGFRDDMPVAAVKLFQAQARQIDAALPTPSRGEL